MELYKFQSQVGGKDAYAIRARQLDENFARLQPQSNGTYGINETANGWSLEIFPALPSLSRRLLCLVYVGGALQWRSIEDIANDSQGSDNNPFDPTPPDAQELVFVVWRPSENENEPAVEDYLSIQGVIDELTDEQKLQIINALLAVLDEEHGGVGLREIERCDGKRMKVLGTLWYDP